LLPSAIFVTVFLLTTAGLWFGLRVAAWLPREHLSVDARNSAHIGIGMLATLAALVLGLMITSAKQSFDERNAEIVQVATSMVLLDRALAGYGEGARAARVELRGILERIARGVDRNGDLSAEGFRTPFSSLSTLTGLQATILAMTPANDTQKWFQARALQLTTDVGHERVLTAERGDRSIPTTLLVVVTVWVVLIYFGLGVFAVSNRTVIAVLVFCALAFACSIFLILELDTPYSGVIGISSAPLQSARAELGK
jgi:hypothetical protein